MSLSQRLTANALYGVALIAIWYVLSGKFDLLHFGTGLLAAVAIAATIQPVDDGTRIRWRRAAAFVPWLFWQVVLSNLRVARIVLSMSCPVQPKLMELSPPVTTRRARAVLGIAATLTPGTLTVDVDDAVMQVHALDAMAAGDLRDGPMCGRVAALFRPDAA